MAKNYKILTHDDPRISTHHTSLLLWGSIIVISYILRFNWEVVTHSHILDYLTRWFLQGQLSLGIRVRTAVTLHMYQWDLLLCGRICNEANLANVQSGEQRVFLVVIRMHSSTHNYSDRLPFKFFLSHLRKHKCWRKEKFTPSYAFRGGNCGLLNWKTDENCLEKKLKFALQHKVW